MADRADVVVIGAGVGGLAVAIRLAATGRRVVVCERRDVTGGKLACLRRDGFSIDVGPSLLTLPDVFDELFRAAGTTLSEHVEPSDSTPSSTTAGPTARRSSFPTGPTRLPRRSSGFAPGAGEQWRRFDERAGRIWEVAARTFLAGPMGGPWQLARRLRSPADLAAIQPHRTLHHLAAAHFTDPRLVQWAGRYATYSGSSPYRAPATLACIAHVEARHGCWYVRGGLESLRSALEPWPRQPGAEIRLGAEVVRIAAPAGRITGVELADGTVVEAPVVVANADAEQVHTDVAAGSAGAARRPPCRSLDEWPGDRCRRARPDARRSGTTTCGSRPTIAPSSPPSRRVAWPMRRRSTPASRRVTDPSQAPAGDENWFILVNAPAGIELDAAAERDACPRSCSPLRASTCGHGWRGPRC